MERSAHRPLRALLALTLAAAFLVVSPAPARAHDSCSIAQPAATGVLGSVLAAVNVFTALVPNVAACADKFADFEVKIERDFETEQTALQTTEAGTLAETYAACADGMAAGMFPCENIDMIAHVSHAELGTTFLNALYGWIDPVTGQAFALVGASNGTVMVDVTDPRAPVVQGRLPSASTAGGSSWRDMKVVNDHLYVVSENTNHGVQVFDLTRLRDWDGTYNIYTMDARYTGHGSAHTIGSNPETGFLYSVGAGQTQSGLGCGTGLHMIDVNQPKQPTFAGCFQAHGYIHETQCVVYDGTAADLRGREICFNSNATSTQPSGLQRISIVDVTDKANPVVLAREAYPLEGYSHQNWLTEDHRFMIHNDELDEQRRGIPTTTRVFNVDDPRNPILHQVFQGYGTNSIDHNHYIKGRVMTASHYTTGLRVLDVQHIEDEGLSHFGFFDMYPENDGTTFSGGTWDNHPFLHVPNLVAVTSMDRGLFLLDVTSAHVAALEADLDRLVDAGGILPNLETKIRHALGMGDAWLKLPRKMGPALSHFDRAVHLLHWQADVVDRTGKPQGDAAGLRELASYIEKFLEDYR